MLSFTLEPLDYLLQKRTVQKNISKKSGVRTFDYNPFMKGLIDFTQFCKDLCFHCEVTYSKDIENLIDAAMHDGVGNYFDETLSVMSDLRSKGIEICLLSNALPNLFDTAGSLTAKNRIFVSYELGLLKPDVEIYKLVLEKLTAKPEEVIFVDDKLKNVEAAKSIGIKGIVFNKDTIREDVKKFVNC